jgi:hypothetical protein
MKRTKTILTISAAAAILGIPAQSALAQTTVFNDTFANGSTVQTTASTPTADSTTYQWFQQGGTPATPTIAPGDLHLVGRTTASSISEVQALFSASPVTLQNVGDSLTLNITFKNTQTIMPAAYPSTLNVGLFNSHGSAPVTGVRLDTSGSGTGGAVGWTGYLGRISGSNNVNSSIITRPAQGPGLTNPNQSQDVLFNNASGSSTFSNPTGALVANSGGTFTAGLTTGNTYTLSYSITLSAAGTVTINNFLYNGSVVDPLALIFSQTGSTSSSIETTYDAFGFGWRYNSVSSASSVDVSSITVMDNIAVIPEPSIFALGGLGAFGLLWHQRRRRA